MKKEELKNLREKYFSAETDLKEEAELFEEANQTTSSLSLWASFINSHKKAAPASLQNAAWAHIQKNERNKSRSLVLGVLAAASVAVFMISSSDFFLSQEMNHQEKEALLEEALSLFPAETPIEEDIIYEDEMLMIYTSSD